MFGFKAGVSIANVDISTDIVDLDTESITNLQIGVLVELPIALNFSVQPELIYVGRGFKQDVSIDEFRTRLAYLDIGALAKLRFGQPEGIGGYVGVGPFFSYALSGETEFNGEEEDIDFEEDELNRTDLSIVPAIGVTFSTGGFTFFVDGRYVLGLVNYDDSGMDDQEIRNRSIGITGGVMVPLN